jgi:hypothetical protein
VKNWSAIVIATLGLALVTLGGIAACKQGEGERCEFDGDCEDGLICNQGKTPHVCDNDESGKQIDASAPPDAPVDAPDAP